jgi:hypothetical protein
MSIWSKFRFGKSVEEVLDEAIRQKIKNRYESYGMKAPDIETFDA